MKVENINYKHKRAKELLFEQTTFEVQEGQVNFVIGPNGAGKTTLIDIFLGFIPTSAEKDYDLGNDYLYINQILPMLGTMTTAQMARFILGLAWGRTIASIDDLNVDIPKAVKEFLVEQWDKKLGEMSYGEMKLVQLLLSLQTNKNVLVLDEPTAFIDRENIGVIFSCTKSHPEKTYLIVTHDYRDFFEIEDYHVTLLDGKGGVRSLTRLEFKDLIHQNSEDVSFLKNFVKGSRM